VQFAFRRKMIDNHAQEDTGLASVASKLDHSAIDAPDQDA
jgi:hypothetical protein